MKNFIILILLLNYNYVLTQVESEYREVEIIVKSKMDNKNISNARVYIIGYEPTETDKNGIAFFPKVPKANYKLEINAMGYKNYIHQNLIKITDDNNSFIIELAELPDNSYSLSGRIIDENSKISLDSVEINLRCGQIKRTTFSDSWGYFDFVLKNGEVKKGKDFRLNIRKKNYKIYPTYENVFYENQIKIPTFELMKKANSLKTIIPPETRKPAKAPMITIVVNPKLDFFFAKNNISIQPTSSFTVKWGFSKKKNLFLFGTGWHLPFHIQTKNNFETLTGQNNQIETNYKISNLGIFSIYYYFRKLKQEQISPFISIAGTLQNQKPIPSIISQNAHEEQIDSYSKFMPQVSGGISIKKGIWEFETFILINYFKINSQNFRFNYFGRADAIIVKQETVQISIGLNIGLVILNH